MDQQFERLHDNWKWNHLSKSDHSDVNISVQKKKESIPVVLYP